MEVGHAPAYPEVANERIRFPADQACRATLEATKAGSGVTNSQIWQQSSYAYTYHYAYRPEIIIFPSAGGCKMKVEDVDESVSVRRLK